MRIFYLFTLILLIASCSNTQDSNKKTIENDTIRDAIKVVNSYKNTDHIIRKLHTLDITASKFTAYYQEETLLTTRDKKLLELTCSKILQRTLNECKKIDLKLSDYERIKIIESIEKSIDNSIDLLDYARKKIKLRIKK